MEKILEFLTEIKRIQTWDRTPAISNEELDTLILIVKKELEEK